MYCTLERTAPSARQARDWLRRCALVPGPQDLLVECQVGDESLELPILLCLRESPTKRRPAPLVISPPSKATVSFR
jgi:hypothetical protein